MSSEHIHEAAISLGVEWYNVVTGDCCPGKRSWLVAVADEFTFTGMAGGLVIGIAPEQVGLPATVAGTSVTAVKNCLTAISPPTDGLMLWLSGAGLSAEGVFATTWSHIHFRCMFFPDASEA
ncbi:MAG: hypothetical protein P8Y45_06150 [Exilibacterium sp.]